MIIKSVNDTWMMMNVLGTIWKYMIHENDSWTRMNRSKQKTEKWDRDCWILYCMFNVHCIRLKGAVNCLFLPLWCRFIGSTGRRTMNGSVLLSIGDIDRRTMNGSVSSSLQGSGIDLWIRVSTHRNTWKGTFGSYT